MWWPNMNDEIEAVAKSCEACHQAKQAPPKAPLQTYQVSSIRLESQAFGLNLKLSSLIVQISSIFNHPV